MRSMKNDDDSHNRAAEVSSAKADSFSRALDVHAGLKSLIAVGPVHIGNSSCRIFHPP